MFVDVSGICPSDKGTVGVSIRGNSLLCEHWLDLMQQYFYLLIGFLFQWDQCSTDVFKVLNECDSAQVHIVVMYISLKCWIFIRVISQPVGEH